MKLLPQVSEYNLTLYANSKLYGTVTYPGQLSVFFNVQVPKDAIWKVIFWQEINVTEEWVLSIFLGHISHLQNVIFK